MEFNGQFASGASDFKLPSERRQSPKWTLKGGIK